MASTAPSWRAPRQAWPGSPSPPSTGWPNSWGRRALAADGRRPVSTPIIAAAVREVLRSSPGLFANVAEHPTTERRLVAAHRELSDVDPEALDALAAISHRSAEVVRIHRAVAEHLGARWYDEQHLVQAAIDALVAGDGGEVEPVVAFLPEELSPPRARLLRALGVNRPVTVVAALTGAEDADMAARQVIGKLDCVVGRRPPTPVSEAAAVIATSDPDDEVRHAIRAILHAAADGVAFDRMAILYAADDPYARLLHDHLAAAGLPFNGAAVTNLAESVVGRTLLRLLALLDRDLRREDVISLVSAVPFRWEGRPAPARAWGGISREAGVVRGLADWQRKLDRHRRELLAEVAEMEGDPDRQWRAERLRRHIAHTESLTACVESLAADLGAAGGAAPWQERVRWCRRMLERHLGDLQQWPDAERRAAERLDAALERLTGLDAVEPGPTAAVFRRTLELELEGGLGRVGRLGEGVLIGPAWSAVGLVLDRVWVLGLSEGLFPSRVRDDSLLPDRERAATAGQLPLRADRVGNQHRQLLAAVAATSPHGETTLLRSRGDLRAGDERSPSRWLSEVAPAHDVEHREVASFAGGLLSNSFPVSDHEYSLRSLVDHLAHHPSLAGHELLHDLDFAASVDLLVGRSGPHFTRFDGLVCHEQLPDLTARGASVSATALETWARCPHQYFVRQLLRVHPLDEPEQRLRIDALAKGTLVHTILERFVEGALTDGRAGPVATSGWSLEHRRILFEIADEEFSRAEARGLTGEPIYWRRDQLLLRRDLDRFLDEDSERRRVGGLEPLRAELTFGLRGAPAATLALDEHRSLALRGSIDLVDRGTDGALHVIDYKTGRFKKVDAADPHDRGQRLQLVLYAEASAPTARLTLRPSTERVLVRVQAGAVQDDRLCGHPRSPPERGRCRAHDRRRDRGWTLPTAPRGVHAAVGGLRVLRPRRARRA